MLDQLYSATYCSKGIQINNKDSWSKRTLTVSALMPFLVISGPVILRGRDIKIGYSHVDPYAGPYLCEM